MTFGSNRRMDDIDRRNGDGIHNHGHGWGCNKKTSRSYVYSNSDLDNDYDNSNTLHLYSNIEIGADEGIVIVAGEGRNQQHQRQQQLLQHPSKQRKQLPAYSRFEPRVKNTKAKPHAKPQPQEEEEEAAAAPMDEFYDTMILNACRPNNAISNYSSNNSSTKEKYRNTLPSRQYRSQVRFEDEAEEEEEFVEIPGTKGDIIGRTNTNNKKNNKSGNRSSISNNRSSDVIGRTNKNKTKSQSNSNRSSSDRSIISSGSSTLHVALEHTLSEHEEVNNRMQKLQELDQLQHQWQQRHNERQNVGGRNRSTTGDNVNVSSSSSSSRVSNSIGSHNLGLEHTLSEHEEFNIQQQNQQQHQKRLSKQNRKRKEKQQQHQQEQRLQPLPQQQQQQQPQQHQHQMGAMTPPPKPPVKKSTDSDSDTYSSDVEQKNIELFVDEDLEEDDESQYYYVNASSDYKMDRRKYMLTILFFVFLMIIGSLIIAISVQKLNKSKNQQTTVGAVQSGLSGSTPTTTTTTDGSGSSSSGGNDIFDHQTTNFNDGDDDDSDECTYSLSVVDRECYNVDESVDVEFTACGYNTEWLGLWDVGAGTFFGLNANYEDWSWTCGGGVKGTDNPCDQSPKDGTVSFTIEQPGTYKVYLIDGDNWPARYKASSLPVIIVDRCGEGENDGKKEDGKGGGDDKKDDGDKDEEDGEASRPTTIEPTPMPTIRPPSKVPAVVITTPTYYPDLFPVDDSKFDHRSKYSVSYTRPPSF